jgi:hypothetical protein
MNKLYSIISLIFVLLISFNIFPQEGDHDFSRFRVLLKSGDRVEGKSGILTPTELQGFTKRGDPIKIPIDDIRVMDRYTGSQAAKGAAIGAGLGLVTALTLILYANADETRELKVNEGVLIFGVTGVYGLIGLAVGSAYSKWERVPLHLSIKYDPSRKLRSFSIEFSISKMMPKT